MRVRSLLEAESRYGQIVGGKWADEALWCVKLDVPEEISAHWINSATGLPATHIYINRDMVPALEATFAEIIRLGLAPQLETFDGCFMIRDVRAAPGHLSCHAYALAIDINRRTNELGHDPTLSKELVMAFRRNGFSWGGYFKRKDGMHFSLGWE